MYRYHNTTNSSGQLLDQYEDKAKTQDERVLAYFQKVGGDLSPSMIWERVFACSVPLTSVRRSMTNLTTRQDLVKTDKQVEGSYGRPEYCWRLPASQMTLL